VSAAVGSAVDYLLIGHIAHDQTPGGARVGGTVAYAGGTIGALGQRAGVLTSARADEPLLPSLAALPGLSLCNIAAAQSTTFVNTYLGESRHQRILSRAAPLHFDDVPLAWRAAPVVHLAPLCDEVDPACAESFPEALLVATPQGWMRTWDAAGTVRAKTWEAAAYLLPRLAICIFSADDIGRDAALEAHYADLARLLVVTRGARGCTVYRRGLPTVDVAAPTVPVVDATGAGDVFAAVFVWLFWRTGNALRAAEVATLLASNSVTRVGLAGIPTAGELAALL
jgi:sugar/nucleoside kinase (ribokinase family)